jgi:Xaa-Pro aminopeptidase
MSSKSAAGGDGLANVLSKILSENVNGKATVLGKRKTEAMRSIEQEAETNDRNKQARILKKIDQLRQMKTPNEYAIEHERSLRKIATKGVVALFNAIASSKKEAEESGTSAVPLSKTKEKLKKRIEGQLRKLNGTGAAEETSADAKSTKAKSSSSWAVLTDDNKSTHQLSANQYNRPKPTGAFKGPKPKGTKHWDEDDDE